MHELAICQDIISQVEKLAVEHKATAIARIILDIGPLSGVEKDLLEAAFPIACAGSLAENAELQINALPIRIECPQCGEKADASAGNLSCPHCGNWRTNLLSGDEMLLRRVEMDT
jgi:hydrogenase nickel incorporation protein HypA/HybF